MPAMPHPAATRAGAPTSPGLADFKRIAMERNPTLRQALAQVDATMSRSFQAGLYPNPIVGYVQEQIGTLGPVTPIAARIATNGHGTPGELVGLPRRSYRSIPQMNILEYMWTRGQGASIRCTMIPRGTGMLTRVGCAA